MTTRLKTTQQQQGATKNSDTKTKVNTPTHTHKSYSNHRKTRHDCTINFRVSHIFLRLSMAVQEEEEQLGIKQETKQGIFRRIGSLTLLKSRHGELPREFLDFATKLCDALNRLGVLQHKRLKFTEFLCKKPEKNQS